jgi:hypothetical protein
MCFVSNRNSASVASEIGSLLLMLQYFMPLGRRPTLIDTGRRGHEECDKVLINFRLVSVYREGDRTAGTAFIIIVA